MKMRKGFTLVELLVVIAIIGLLVGILFPVLSRAQEASKRAVCTNNLKGIGQALHTYISTTGMGPRCDWGKQYTGNFVPSSTANAYVTDNWCRGVDDMETNSIYTNMGKGNGKYYYYSSVTYPLWMLIKDGSVQPKQFLCPSATGTKEFDPMTIDGNALSTVIQTGNTWNFYRASHLSYSPINMYCGPTASGQWKDPKPDYVLMGDENNGDSLSISTTVNVLAMYRGNTTNPPTREDIRKYQSQNHRSEGQNLLFGDTHVKFADDPFGGPGNDNVFALNQNTVEGAAEIPVYNDDVTTGDGTNNPLKGTSTYAGGSDVCLLKLRSYP